MKKCGATPNVDTYVQLAHALAKLQMIQKNSQPPSARHILHIVGWLKGHKNLDWAAHKGVGILLYVIKNCVLSSIRGEIQLSEDTQTKLLHAAKTVWQKSSPLKPASRMIPEDKLLAVQNYIRVMSISTEIQDLQELKALLPYLLTAPSKKGLLLALRVAQALNDPDLAVEYWKKFQNLPFNLRAAETCLIILSESAHARDALQILDQCIAASEAHYIQPKIYALALFACLRLPSLDIAKQIYQRALKNPNARPDIGIHGSLLEAFIRGTENNWTLNKHSPDYFYSIIRMMDVPELMRTTDAPVRQRLKVISQIKRLILWRLKQPMVKEMVDIIKGDLRFYKRWTKILRKWAVERDPNILEDKAEEDPTHDETWLEHELEDDDDDDDMWFDLTTMTPRKF